MTAAQRMSVTLSILLAPLLSLLLLRTAGHAQPALATASPTIVPVADVPRPRGVTVDNIGNLYSIDRDLGTIYKVTPSGAVSAIADLPDVFEGYIGPVFDPASGDIFVGRYVDIDGYEVLRITPAGEIYNFASISYPAGFAADGQGNLLVTSYHCPGSVYKVTSGGIVSQFGDGLCHPDGLAIGPNGDIFVGDRGTHRIMRISAAGGTASVFASGFDMPLAVAFDRTGMLFVADYGNGTIYRVDANGSTSPVVSGLNQPDGLVFDQQNQLFISNYGTDQIVKLEGIPEPSPTPTPTISPTPTVAIPPIADRLTINGGALTTTSTNVRLDLSAANADNSQIDLSTSLSNDGANWAAWTPYTSSTVWQLAGSDGMKTVYGRFKNSSGAVSAIVSDTIMLDTAVQSEYGLTINDGSLYTNQITVQLTISARPYTAAMQVSNDGGFGDAAWEPYTAHTTWQIPRYRNQEITRLVYIRFRDAEGNVSATYLDDIVLDVNPPDGDVSVINSEQGVQLALAATDDVSGVANMRASASPNFDESSWEPYASSRVWDFDVSPTVYVQFRDNAGNVSLAYTASLTTEHVIFLPLVRR